MSRGLKVFPRRINGVGGQWIRKNVFMKSNMSRNENFSRVEIK
jgi:hypothetical protein